MNLRREPFNLVLDFQTLFIFRYRSLILIPRWQPRNGNGDFWRIGRIDHGGMATGRRLEQRSRARCKIRNLASPTVTNNTLANGF
jgi:hypothetical protein